MDSNYTVVFRKLEMSSSSRSSFMNLATAVSHLVNTVTSSSKDADRKIQFNKILKCIGEQYQ